MKTLILSGEGWVYGTPTQEGQKYRKEIVQGSSVSYETCIFSLTAPATEAIRVITVGAMQSRFSIEEEVNITHGEDDTAKVFASRMFNSKYVNLDDQELFYGIGYIVNYLEGLGVLTATPSGRIDQLLLDGTEAEKY